MKYLAIAAIWLAAVPAAADTRLDAALEDHIRPGFATLSAQTADLAQAAAETCAADDPALRAAFHDAWDAWISVSHLSFGPVEEGNRGFAMGFWPDTRGAPPRTLQGLITAGDAIAYDVEGHAAVSVAARGFTALEFPLHDAALP